VIHDLVNGDIVDDLKWSSNVTSAYGKPCRANISKKTLQAWCTVSITMTGS